jgi:DNA-binding PadR family transcriptional regulator
MFRPEICLMHRHYRRHRRRARSHRMGGLGGRFFAPGEVRLALLALIAEQPRHGYELMKELEARSGGVYRASAGSVYPTLQQLEDEGLVSSEAANGRRVYRATDAGRREVEDEESAVRSIWRRAERWGDWGFAFDPEALEIARPAQRLMKTAFRAIARDRADPDRVREILERARREIRNLEEEEREAD